MYIRANEATAEIVVRDGLDEPYRAEFSDNDLAQVPADVGEVLLESDRYDVEEHDPEDN